LEDLTGLRNRIHELHIAHQDRVLEQLVSVADISEDVLNKASSRGAALVQAVRDDDQPGLMEVFLAEYGLSTDEGVALMCLAEALLRVPDSDTIDDLIEDKIATSAWGEHLGQSSSSLVNAATWGLMLTGKVLDDNHSGEVTSTLRGAVKRLGEPLIRVAVKRAMKEMGKQFVLGETIKAAMKRGEKRVQEGYTYSFDMLGEMALTEADATSFFTSYKQAIEELSKSASSTNIKDNPGISVKLSALHPRYEPGQHKRVMTELRARVMTLALIAKNANMGFNIDAEESERLDLSLDLIESVLQSSELAGWHGFGVVVQAYSKRASTVIDWLYAMATKYDRKIMIRLVKGAYWDSEIKRAQVEGLADFPVFTVKSATDVSYICCAKQLLAMNDRVFPQFATHNAHSVAAIQEIAGGQSFDYEFQRLHGMGEALYRKLKEDGEIRCRIYAPVGEHRDLLAYLVRRLLENGANSSFVNQVVDEEVPPQVIARDPFARLAGDLDAGVGVVVKPTSLFSPDRQNSIGWDLQDAITLTHFEKVREPYMLTQYEATPLLAKPFLGNESIEIRSPYDLQDKTANVMCAADADIDLAFEYSQTWFDCSPEERSAVLLRAADLYERNSGLFFALLAREAGKTPADAVAELREAVDFLRYYAVRLLGDSDRQPLGTVVCISPWNFPLAIFTGQISAALAAGNGVLAKPAESTPVVAHTAVRLLHEAGVPLPALQLLIGEGKTVGSALVSRPEVRGVCFTGSTETAVAINRALAENASADVPFIAETGGLNAMIVDSTALPEQATRDIVTSAFQSAGQRCSALRVLYLQEEIAEPFLEMLYGAMDELTLGDPSDIATDVGPVISQAAQSQINAYLKVAMQEGRVLKQLAKPNSGFFVAPSVIQVKGIGEIEREVFGPVLHVAIFRREELNQVIDDINNSEYGLTFGLHSRIDDRVELVTQRVNAGNLYINRNQVGAVVGSQPFGGENLSGTGPKAGGPRYLQRFMKPKRAQRLAVSNGKVVELSQVQDALDKLIVQREAVSSELLPGPTGESNRLTVYPRGRVLCLGPTLNAAKEQARVAQQFGCATLVVCPGAVGDDTQDGLLPRELLTTLNNIDVVVCWCDDSDAKAIRGALAQREGAIIPFVSHRDLADYCILERHVCIDTTAAGGNASLLAAAS